MKTRDLGKARNGVVLALAVLAGIGARAADVYESIGPDGVPRYSNEPRDPSYRLILADGSTAAVQPQTHAPIRHVAAAPRKPGVLQPLIDRSAREHGVSPALIEAVVAVESGHNPTAVSRKGAMGAMQLMPATAARYGLEARGLFDAERNIDVGVRHLKDLLARYRGDVAIALAAYNAGAGAVERNGGRIPPYPETIAYVAAVLARSSRAVTP